MVLNADREMANDDICCLPDIPDNPLPPCFFFFFDCLCIYNMIPGQAQTGKCCLCKTSPCTCNVSLHQRLHLSAPSISRGLISQGGGWCQANSSPCHSTSISSLLWYRCFSCLTTFLPGREAYDTRRDRHKDTCTHTHTHTHTHTLAHMWLIMHLLISCPIQMEVVGVCVWGGGNTHITNQPTDPDTGTHWGLAYNGSTIKAISASFLYGAPISEAPPHTQ